MAETLDLYFDGVLKTCTKKEDRNGEHLYEAEDGSFVKFPVDGDLDEMVTAYNSANDKEVEVIPDVEYGKVITHDAHGNVVE